MTADAFVDPPRECSPGWEARCRASRGERCRCACGGYNHGGVSDQLNLLALIAPPEPRTPTDDEGAEAL